MIAEIIALSLPGVLFIVCAVAYIVHTINKSKKMLICQIVILLCILLLYITIFMINMTAYWEVHHPTASMDLLHVADTDIFYDNLDGKYIKIIKHPFQINNPYEMIDANEDEIKNSQRK